MTTQSNLADTLEEAIATAVTRAHRIVEDGTTNTEGLAAADPRELADALGTANVLVAKLEAMRHGIALATLDRRDDERPEKAASTAAPVPNVIDAIDTLHDVRSLVQLVFAAAEHDAIDCSGDIARTCNVLNRKIGDVLAALVR